MSQELTPEEEHALHERWVVELEDEWGPLFEACPDAVYIYIDDEHKICNQRLADLFGFSVAHFKEMESFLDECVDQASIDLVVHTYMTHFEQETKPVRFEFTARRADGVAFPVTAFQIPIAHAGALMTLGFIRPGEDA